MKAYAGKSLLIAVLLFIAVSGETIALPKAKPAQPLTIPDVKNLATYGNSLPSSLTSYNPAVAPSQPSLGGTQETSNISVFDDSALSDLNDMITQILLNLNASRTQQASREANTTKPNVEIKKEAEQKAEDAEAESKSRVEIKSESKVEAKTQKTEQDAPSTSGEETPKANPRLAVPTVANSTVPRTQTSNRYSSTAPTLANNTPVSPPAPASPPTPASAPSPRSKETKEKDTKDTVAKPKEVIAEKPKDPEPVIPKPAPKI